MKKNSYLSKAFVLGVLALCLINLGCSSDSGNESINEGTTEETAVLASVSISGNSDISAAESTTLAAAPVFSKTVGSSAAPAYKWEITSGQEYASITSETDKSSVTVTGKNTTSSNQKAIVTLTASYNGKNLTDEKELSIAAAKNESSETSEGTKDSGDSKETKDSQDSKGSDDSDTKDTTAGTTITLSYSTSHGTAPSSKSVTKTNSAYTITAGDLPSLTAEGYTFSGWAVSENSTAIIEAGAVISEDTTLYAVWASQTSTETESSLSAPVITLDYLTISWDAVEGATEYYVYETAGDSQKEYNTTKLSYTATRGENDIGKYCSYTVKAYDGKKFSLASNEVKIPTKGNAELTAPVLTANGTTLSWNKVKYANYYEILRRAENESDFQYYTSSTGSYFYNSSSETISYTIGEDFVTDYYYKVIASDSWKKLINETETSTYYNFYKNNQVESNIIKIEKSVIHTYTSSETLSWTNVHEAEYYCIYKSATVEGLKNLSETDYFETVTNNSWALSQNLIKDTYYAIRAFWKDYKGDSVYSGLSEIVTIKGYQIDRTMSAPVLNVNGTTLSWKANQRTSTPDYSYYIYKAESEDDFLGRKLEDFLENLTDTTTFEGELNCYYAIIVVHKYTYRKYNRNYTRTTYSPLSNIVQITTTEKKAESGYTMESLAGVWRGTSIYTVDTRLNADGTGSDYDGAVTWSIIDENTITLTDSWGTYKGTIKSPTQIILHTPSNYAGDLVLTKIQ